MTRVLALLSGGLDSTVMVGQFLDAGHHVECLAVQYGQTHWRELDAAAHVARHYRASFTVIDVNQIGSHLHSALTTGGVSKVVPNRNAILLSIAIGVAGTRGLDAVAFAVNADDARDFYDCRPAFIDVMHNLATANGVDLWTPFLTTPKSQVVVEGIRLDAPLATTRSCYANTREPCGVCDACHDRADALRKAGHVVPR